MRPGFLCYVKKRKGFPQWYRQEADACHFSWSSGRRPHVRDGLADRIMVCVMKSHQPLEQEVEAWKIKRSEYSVQTQCTASDLSNVNNVTGILTGCSKKRSPPRPTGCTSPGEKLMTFHWNITHSKFICQKSWSESFSMLQNRIFCKKGVSMGEIGICAYWQHLPLDSPSLWDK